MRNKERNSIGSAHGTRTNQRWSRQACRIYPLSSLKIGLMKKSVRWEAKQKG